MGNDKILSDVDNGKWTYPQCDNLRLPHSMGETGSWGYSVGQLEELQSELRRVRDLVESVAAPESAVIGNIVRSIRVVETVTDFAGYLFEADTSSDSLFIPVTLDLLKQLRLIFEQGHTATLAEWLREFHEKMIYELHHMERRLPRKGGGAETLELHTIRTSREDLENVQEIMQTLATTSGWQRAAEQAAILAGEAAARATDAAGTAGEQKLSSYFDTYAKRELLTADIFRYATLATILLAAGLSVHLVLHVPSLNDTGSIVSRVTIVLAAAAISTYLARQSAQHRRVGNWARGLQVQLQAFGAFMTPVVDDATKNAIYTQFASRVLGPPPVNDKTPAESELDPNVIELIKALVNRS